MASKKFDLPEPFLPTITLCMGLKGSISDWDRKLRNPEITTWEAAGQSVAGRGGYFRKIMVT